VGSPNEITLYVADRAPMAHPVLIMLREKNIDCRIEYIDPYDKPDWYLDMTPNGAGQVPLLVVDGIPLFESTAINEYLDETIDEGCFLPKDPVIRARNRAWALQAFDFLMAQAGMMVVKNKDEHFMARQMFIGKLQRVEAQIGDGPFFNGADIALVDFQFAPVLVRQEVLDRLYGTDVLTQLPKVARWTKHLVDRPSVHATLSPPHATKSFDEIFLPSFYDSFLTTQRAGRLNLGAKP
jgi:glutathione S-transferase